MKNRNKSLRGIVQIASLVFFIALGYQNCSRIGFETTDELVKAGIDGELRGMSLDPEQKESRPAIDVTTILDNSQSMQPIQDSVASAFQTVTKRLRSFSGEMSLFTTTQRVEFDKASVFVSKWLSYNEGNKLIELPYDQLGMLSAATPYRVINRYSLSSTHTLDGYPLPFWGHMSDQEFDSFTEAYSNSILNIGTLGDDQEQGLCTILRAAEAKKDSQSFQAFILAANEDDSTEWEKCLKEEVQEVSKVPKDPILAQCQMGDQDCEYTYEMAYKPNREEKLNYSYRRISETIKYTSTTPVETWNLKYRYYQHKKYYDYKVKMRKESLGYQKMILVDNLPVPEGVQKVFNLNNGTSVNGYCATEYPEGLPVSCDDIRDELPASETQYGLVEGSCKRFCVNNLSAVKTVAQENSYEGGSCIQANLQENVGIDCNSSEEVDAATKAGIDQNDIFECKLRCKQDGNSLRTFNLSSKPGNCNNTCSANQKNDIVAALNNHISARDIYECNTNCSGPSYPDKSFDPNLPDIFACEGVDLDKNGSSAEIDCMNNSQLRQLAADKLPSKDPDDIRSCTYQCSQTIKTASKTLGNPAQCQLGNQPCSAGQRDDVKLHFLSTSGTNEAFLVAESCVDECRELAPRSKCTGKKYKNPDMCLGMGLQTLVEVCS